MKNPRNLLWLTPLLLLVTSPLWKPGLAAFLQPRGDYAGDETVALTDESRRFLMDAITITLTSQQRTEWQIHAKRAYTGQSELEIGMSEVYAVYTSENQEKTIITSSRGTYRVEERHLLLIDNVVVTRPAEQQEMRSDLLHYYDANKMLVSPGSVTINAPAFTIKAGRLDYDLASNGYDLSSTVICDF